MNKIKLILTLLSLILILSGCSNKQNAKIKTIDIDESKLISQKEEQEDIMTEEDYKEKNEYYRPLVGAIYTSISEHYSNLKEEYEKQKADFDINEWTIFLNSWNIELGRLRTELDTYKVTGHSYNLFYAKNQLSIAASDIAVVWMSYSDLLENPENSKAMEDLKYFDENINKELSECATYVKEQD